MPVINITRQTTLASYVEIANSPFKKMKGLLGRLGLSQGYCLVIPGCNSIHMFFMKFAIDVVFVDKEKKVVGLSANIQPFQLSPVFWKSSCAIELPAGTIKATQTHQGDQLSVSSSW